MYRKNFDVLVEHMDDAKRILGMEHPSTKQMQKQYELVLIEKARQAPQASLISDDSHLKDKKVSVLRATKDGAKYVIEIVNDDSVAKQRNSRSCPVS